MGVDGKTGKRAKFKTKQAIIESFKINNYDSESLLDNIDDRLNTTNILKFY